MAIQASGALLDLCVLAVIDHGETYGYVLTQKIRHTLGVAESSIYPVLRRLQKNAYLNIDDRPHDGRNRRYYSITGTGRSHLETLITDWTTFRNHLDCLIGQEN
jgi:PadR family transcriptional regulator PadR